MERSSRFETRYSFVKPFHTREPRTRRTEATKTIVLVDLNAGITRNARVDDFPACATVAILVKDDVSFIFDKAASLVVFPQAHKHVFVGVRVMRAQLGLESLSRFPRVVMRNLGVDVVSNVRLADTVHEVRSDRAEKVTVNCAQGSALEVPLACAVVGKTRISVLEVRDHDKPVVGVEVRNDIVLEDGR